MNHGSPVCCDAYRHGYSLILCRFDCHVPLYVAQDIFMGFGDEDPHHPNIKLFTQKAWPVGAFCHFFMNTDLVIMTCQGMVWIFLLVVISATAKEIEGGQMVERGISPIISKKRLHL